MPNPKITRLKDIIKILNDGVSEERFLKSFQSVLKQIALLEKKLIERNDNKTSLTEKELAKLQQEFIQIIARAKKESDSTFGGIKRRMIERINSLFIKNQVKERIGAVDNKLKEVDQKLAQVKSGRDGSDGREGIDGKDGSPDTSEEIANKLETLKGDGRLKIEAILNLETRLKELNQRRGGMMGGGVGKLALEAKFVDNELIGTGDGTTTIFALKNTPNPTASLRIVVGSGELFLTDDWTISGKALTFLTAPPDGAKIRGSYRK